MATMKDKAPTERLTYAEAESKFGKGNIAAWEIEPHGLVIFKKPGRSDFRRFMAAILDDKVDSVNAMEGLVRVCAVQPKGKALEAIFDDRPAFPTQVAPELQKMAGVDESALVKVES